MLNAWDTSVLTFVTIYYLFINKNWFYLTLTSSILGVVAKIFILFIAPESPRWLLMQDKREEAIASFNQIAKINGVKSLIPHDAYFIELSVPRQNLNTSAISEFSNLVKSSKS